MSGDHAQEQLAAVRWHLQELVQLKLAFVEALPVRRVNHVDKRVCLVEVVAPASTMNLSRVEAAHAHMSMGQGPLRGLHAYQ